MPGTTRYSATFDRTYEEDDRVGPAPLTNARRSRSHSLQALSGLDGGRPYTPLGIRPPSQRSSSTDSGKAPDQIPTRTVANAAVKAHNNPFQFVKVGTCPLYKNAEELLKKTKEVKKQDVFREEEEDWQSNLDSWKSRRRKMSEDVFRRQEEIKQFELEEQSAQATQKKTKTFSEMVEQRAHRGRALSLCLISNPLEFQDWEFENKSNTNGSCSTFTDESEENSTVNSEDEGVSLRGRSGRPAHHDNQKNLRTNGDAHIEQNGSSKLETQNGDYSNVQMKPKEYVDSGLESISSSSHRAGDTPDSGSDFSQDSNSSIDCESPRTGVNILEEFSSKSLQMSGEEVSVKLSLSDKAQGFGFEFQGGKDVGQVVITSVTKGSKADCFGVHAGDQIMNIEGSDVSSKTHAEIVSLVQKGQEKKEINLLLWRHTKTTNGFNTEEKHVESPVKPNKTDNQNAKSECHEYEKSIESENEMYVDDFEELQRQSELLTSSKQSETNCTNSQAQSDGKKSVILSSEKDSVNSAPKLTEPVSNGTVDKQNANEMADSETSTESPKKNIIKVKRVRRKGVYALDVSGTPNTIPQEGIPVGSLFPLSPVTELPSPADETRTMSSTLSSTTPVSNAQNGIVPKETEVKLNPSIIKENNKTLASEPKTIVSKSTDEPKISLSKTTDDKTGSSSIPSSPTVTTSKAISLESSVEEKPKIPSSPKKVKVKVKKANTSEQKSSESSVAAKEIPSDSANQSSDLSVKKLAPVSLPKTDQRSDSLPEDKSIKANKTENLESSQNRDSSSSAESAAVIPDTKSTTSEDKLSVANIAINSDKTRNQTVKNNQSISTTVITPAKMPQTPVDEKSKPFVQKKENTKPKEKASLSLATSAVCANIETNELQKSPSATVSACNVVNAIPSNTSIEKNEISCGASAKSDFIQSSVNAEGNKSGPKKTRTKKKVT
jgi:hypothetical protein